MDSTSFTRANKMFDGPPSDTTKLLAESISGKSCPICLCDVEASTAAVIIPCKHAYCIECIRGWSNHKPNCPLCKVDFNSCFTKIDLVSQTFQKVNLQTEGKAVTSPGLSSPFRPGRPLPDQLDSLRRYGDDSNLGYGEESLRSYTEESLRRYREESLLRCLEDSLRRIREFRRYREEFREELSRYQEELSRYREELSRDREELSRYGEELSSYQDSLSRYLARSGTPFLNVSIL